MTNTPEIARNNPATTPSKSPSDTLLKNFRATLEQRWKEFQSETLKEAGGVNSLRDNHPDYKKAKATFDEAMSALNSITDDAALKTGLESPGRLASVMNTLRDYIASADKQKGYNTVLSRTFADLTTLKAQMTEKAEDKKDAEVARAALPVVTATASVSPEAPAVNGELNNMVKEGVAEATQAVTEEIQGLKKNPLQKVAEWMGFTPEDTISDIKSALSDLKDAKGFDKISAKFSLMIALFMGKIFGVDFAKSLTPEEMKLAGIKPKVEKKVGEKLEEKPQISTETKENTKNILYSKGIGYVLSLSMEDDTTKRQMKDTMQSSAFANENMTILESYWKEKNFQELGKKYNIEPKTAEKMLTFLFGDTLMANTLRKIPTQAGPKFMDRVLALPKDMIHAAHLTERVASAASISDIGSAIHGAFADIFKQTDGKVDDASIQATLSELGITGETASFFLLTNISIDTRDPQMSSGNKKFLEERLLPFWRDFSGPFIDRYIPENMRGKVKEAIKSGLQLKDVFQLYLLSKGEKDFSKLSSFQQTTLFAKLWGMMGDSPALRGETLDKQIIEGIFSSNATFPKEVYEVLGRTMESVAKKAMQGIYGALSEIWNGIPDLEKYAIAGVFTLLLFIGWRFRIIFSIVRWSAILAVLSVIAPKAYAMINGNKTLGEKLEKAYESDIAGKR